MLWSRVEDSQVPSFAVPDDAFIPSGEADSHHPRARDEDTVGWIAMWRVGQACAFDGDFRRKIQKPRTRRAKGELDPLFHGM